MSWQSIVDLYRPLNQFLDQLKLPPLAWDIFWAPLFFSARLLALQLTVKSTQSTFPNRVDLTRVLKDNVT